MIYSTGIISLIIQIIVGIIDFIGINIEISPNDQILKDLLKVELAVQIIEFIFYVWLIYYSTRTSKNITPFRYIDWSITTPLMLMTLSAFLKHNGYNSTNLRDFLFNHTESIVKIVILNASMLAFGLIGEFGYLAPLLSTALGFIPFALNFQYIKETFLLDDQDQTKKYVFYWFVFFWSLYGVFALMNYTTKNTGYNILDIFSKNFFGIFLAYIIWSKSKKNSG
jgi:hypothetical protein